MRLTKILLFFTFFFSIANAQTAEEYYNEGILNTRNSNYIKAIENFSKTIELNPNDVEAYYSRQVKRIKNQTKITDNDYPIQRFFFFV